MTQMQHDPDVVGFYGTLKGDNGLKVPNEERQTPRRSVLCNPLTNSS